MCSCGRDLPKHFWGNGSTGELWLFFWLQRTVRQPLGASLWQTPWWFHIASEGSTAQSWLRDFTEAGFLKPSQVLQLGGTRFFSRTRREQLHVVHFCHPFPHRGAPGPCGTGLPEALAALGPMSEGGHLPLCASKTLSYHQDASPSEPVLRQGSAPPLCDCRTPGVMFLLAQLVWLSCSASQHFSEPLPGQSTHCSSGRTSETHLEASTQFV